MHSLFHPFLQLFYRVLQYIAELLQVIFRDNFLMQQIDQRIRQIRFTKFHLNTQTFSILTDASIQLPELIGCQTIPVQQINRLMIQLFNIGFLPVSDPISEQFPV